MSMQIYTPVPYICHILQALEQTKEEPNKKANITSPSLIMPNQSDKSEYKQQANKVQHHHQDINNNSVTDSRKGRGRRRRRPLVALLVMCGSMAMTTRRSRGRTDRFEPSIPILLIVYVLLMYVVQSYGLWGRFAHCFSR
jgi:lipopolysaccharide export LptBFGC system permease protein LptF